MAEAGQSFSPAGKLDNLSRKQKREVEEQSRPNAALIHETIRAEGESELERTWWALGLSGLAAGLSIGFSMVLQGELHAHLPDGAAVKTIAPFGYTAGFVIVVLGRQQLFTENTLTPICRFCTIAICRPRARFWRCGRWCLRPTSSARFCSPLR